jgi:hypothetical protein
LISFISIIVYSSISHGIKDLKLCTNKALFDMNNLMIMVYDDDHFRLNELNKIHKEIFTALNLECPFTQEKGTKLVNNSFSGKYSTIKRKKGRRKGNKTTEKIKLKDNIQASNASDSGGAPKKGRCRRKGSKNKEKSTIPS